MASAIIPWKNAFDKADPTPHQASVNLARQACPLRRDEVVELLADETGEDPSVVGSRFDVWRAHKLIPPPRSIVPAHGKQGRGTRGDYGAEHIIGYRVILALRPRVQRGRRGQFLTIKTTRPDRVFGGEASRTNATSAAIAEAVSALMRAYRHLPPRTPDPGRATEITRTDIVEAMTHIASLLGEGEKASVAVALVPDRRRLNEHNLQRLLPLSRGVNREVLARLADEHLTDADQWLDRESLLMIWSKVVAAEVHEDVTPRDFVWTPVDVVAMKDGQAIWCLSQSRWGVSPKE